VQYDDKAFSLTDATSFGVMERLGTSQAFTFDRNFLQYGIPPLSPP
jgi:predicted nucleic acid-binding protein